ncbi:uncharacterized protein LOC143217540 [Lasioglossum baleicum]|uniref:uncharacterized protein LOC143217540 n=1 Tax=Lasioglossum baleicum TaxID=434251 RepID=UPI003FCE6896
MDEIRIPIQQQDLYTLPCKSFLYVEGKLSLPGKLELPVEGESHIDTATLENNTVAFMFEEIRYELNGVEIDRSRNPGATTTLKNYVSLSRTRSSALSNAGWLYGDDGQKQTATATAAIYFNFCVPMSVLLGFCEDYKRIILDSDRPIDMTFRSWDLYEYPLLQTTTKHTWAIKTALQMEKPRYVIFALQTNPKNNLTKTATRFDHCTLTNIRLYLNSETYPYDDLNIDFEKGKYALLYDMYAKFQESYYGNGEALLDVTDFLQYGPLVVLDCSRQNEVLKNATVDVRIEFECRTDVPPSTTAYCLIIHDRIMEYNPVTNIVRKIT